MRSWMMVLASLAAASTQRRWGSTPSQRTLTVAAQFQPSAARTLWLTTTGISLPRTTAPACMEAAPTRMRSTTTRRQALRHRARFPPLAAPPQMPSTFCPLQTGVGVNLASSSDVPTRRGPTTTPWPTSILACAIHCSQVALIQAQKTTSPFTRSMTDHAQSRAAPILRR